MKKEAKDKRAMDASIKRAIKDERQRAEGVREAERDVFPYIGQIAGLARNEEEVYRLALDSMKIDVETCILMRSSTYCWPSPSLVSVSRSSSVHSTPAFV